ncbi:cathelicidin-related antimicrobial peptide Na_CRAMP-like isoform X1 [Hemitrygon akajei]|uniref:cathelicidin-related antimicrobial peptide Na_CRAMP-like isoform X1 n=1 Tax=Hemitrygon akajei TaxID=2704970 RepID=UPI003BF973B1
MRSWFSALVCIAVAAVGHGSPIQRTPTSKDALQAAIHKYNAGSGQENLYKLMRTYCIAMKELTQGREYEIGFSLMETVCTKGMEDRMQQCAFIENGNRVKILKEAYEQQKTRENQLSRQPQVLIMGHNL